MRDWGFTYAARQINNEPWEVAFMGRKTYRGRNAELSLAALRAYGEARADGVGES